MLLAVVQSALATPLPSPEVIEKTFTVTVPAQTPTVVVQAAQFAAVFVAALVLSVVHQATEYLTAKEAGWGANLNRLLATGYSAGVGLVGVSTMHLLGSQLQELVALGLTTAVALAGSFWTFEVRKFLASITGFVQKQGVAPADSSLPTVTNP